MSCDMVVYLSKQLLWQALLLASPIVLVSLICGVVVSILQVITQIQDSTLNFIPKILAVAFTFILCGEWMLHSLLDFAQRIIHNIPEALQ